MCLPSKISGHGAAPRCLSAQRAAAEYLAVRRFNVGVVCPAPSPSGGCAFDASPGTTPDSHSHARSRAPTRCVTSGITRIGVHWMGERNRGRRIVRSRNAMRLRSAQPRNCPSLTPRRRSRTETGSQARTASGITIQSSTPRRHRSASPATIDTLDWIQRRSRSHSECYSGHARAAPVRHSSSPLGGLPALICFQVPRRGPDACSAQRVAEHLAVQRLDVRARRISAPRRQRGPAPYPHARPAALG